MIPILSNIWRSYISDRVFMNRERAAHRFALAGRHLSDLRSAVQPYDYFRARLDFYEAVAAGGDPDVPVLVKATMPGLFSSKPGGISVSRETQDVMHSPKCRAGLKQDLEIVARLRCAYESRPH